MAGPKKGEIIEYVGAVELLTGNREWRRARVISRDRRKKTITVRAIGGDRKTFTFHLTSDNWREVPILNRLAEI